MRSFFPSNKVMTLSIFRASDHGWTSAAFHNLCDNEGPTIIIAKANGYIFGGVTYRSWGSANACCKADSLSFMFTIDRNNISKKVSPKNGQ
jgi:hypothetical protein